MDHEADVWSRIAGALFRRLVGSAAAQTSIRLESWELQAAAVTKREWETEDEGSLLARFETTGS